ncbi:protein SIEVE ELEMENT OCCLUSION B [Neltuma alba]|uniref:protein SIEVE ELEMENT OCCLUSION B n=1 Tax=Neltuma alba TaxID=207710 RepID=UPI0010A43E35|nr:protein SIEVE ELEMENT OCCLUSION B-like [Prosopis alba]
MAGIIKAILNHGEHEHNPLTLSDEQILDQIYTTHVHSDAKFDVAPLFDLVDNILKRSTHIVDNVVQGHTGSPEHIDDKIPHASFFSPLCTIKQISSEMSCKPPGEDVAHKTTLSILNKLSGYNWDAKAVLTLAAFALEYGEFWLLAQLQNQPLEPIAKSVAILKRVPTLTKPQAVRKHRQAIVEINNLIKATLQVIEVIFELESLSSYDTRDVPALGPALEQIPVDVYWSIITIVAIVTQIDCLTTDSEHKQELSHFGQKINIILSKLRKQVLQCRQQIDEANYNKSVRKMFQTPTEIMEMLKVLLFWKDVPQTPIYDGATKTLVSLEVLRKQNVFLFVSTLDITEEDISILRPVYERTRRESHYRIVWVPIVEEWNDQLKKKFEFLKIRMPWLVVHHFGSTKGFKFIKEEWHFKKQPMIVVMSPQSKILHQNAFHLLQVWGLEAFPFTSKEEERLEQESSWIYSLFQDHPKAPSIKGNKHIFFYGGKDKEWIQQFTKYAGALANDVTMKEAGISIELFCVENEHQSVLSKFWSGIESLFVTKMNKTTNAVTQEVQKMLSYKNETGWALLSKGPTVVVAGHGTTIIKTVAEFDKWKEVVAKHGFEVGFKEYHQKVVKTIHRCTYLEIPNVAGKIPEIIKCPECDRTMNVFVSYKCCHNGGSA